MGPSGPIGYRTAVFMKGAGHRGNFSLSDILPGIFINLRSHEFRFNSLLFSPFQI